MFRATYSQDVKTEQEAVESGDGQWLILSSGQTFTAWPASQEPIDYVHLSSLLALENWAENLKPFNQEGF